MTCSLFFTLLMIPSLLRSGVAHRAPRPEADRDHQGQPALDPAT
jgi:hypothetical protein